MNRLMLFLVLINITGEVIAQPSKLACQNLKNADLTDIPLEELMEIPIFLVHRNKRRVPTKPRIS